MDDFDTTGHSPLNLRAEQQRDSDIKRVILWFETGPPTTAQYFSADLKKYLKQYPRLAMFDGVLHRKFYSHTGNSFIKQYCVPIHLQKEVLFRIHNSVWSGHKGVSRTIAEFRKRFYFPNITETLTDYIRNCVTCLQTKPSPTAALRPPLQPMSSLQNFPADVLLIDLLGKMHPSPYTFILSGRCLLEILIRNTSDERWRRHCSPSAYFHLPETFIHSITDNLQSRDRLYVTFNEQTRHNS